MTKPNLRELFGRFNDPVSCYSVWVHDLLEALVEAVEPEMEPEPDIEMLRIQYDREELVRELTEAKAKTEKWRTQHGAVQVLRIDERAAGMQLGSQLAEVKAEIERLRKKRDDAEQDARCCEDCLAELKADAEIGRLVLGMAKWTRLVRNNAGDYFAQTVVKPISGIWKTQSPRCGPAAEALRAIQREESG